VDLLHQLHLASSQRAIGKQRALEHTREWRHIMTSEMAFECLLVSADPSVNRTLSPMLRDLSITTNLCQDPASISFHMNERSTDLFVVDVDGPHGDEAIRQIRGAQRYHKPTIVAVSTSGQKVPAVDVHLRKPITRDSGIQSLRTAYSRMVRDFRKHTRSAIMQHTLAKDQSDMPVSIIVTNIGEGGVGLASHRKLAIGSQLSFETTLPGLDTKIHIRARVLWNRDYGAAGAEFVYLKPFHLHLLHAWLDSRYRLKKPLIPVEDPVRLAPLQHLS
jgi:CheY-like chemotaxis protein